MNIVYRDFVVATDVTHTSPTLVRLYRKRVARAAAGVVVAATAITSLIFVAWDPITESAAPAVLYASFPLGIVTWFVMRAFGLAANLGRHHSLAEAERNLYRIETWSIALPLVGVAFAMPLTLHALYAHLTDVREFTGWMKLSGVLVSHAHLALAVHAFLFADALHRARDVDAKLPIERGWLMGLAAAVAASAFPGALLLMVPPAITLFTGLAFIPASYAVMRWTWKRERNVLHAALAPSSLADERYRTR